MRVQRRNRSAAKRHARLAFERLDDRLVFASIWDGTGDGVHWHDPRNWSSNQPPEAGADVIIESAAPLQIEIDQPIPPLRSFQWKAPNGRLHVVRQSVQVATQTTWQGGQIVLEESRWKSDTIGVGSILEAVETEVLDAQRIDQLNSGQFVGEGTWLVQNALLSASQVAGNLTLRRARVAPRSPQGPGPGVLRVAGRFVLDAESTIEIDIASFPTGTLWDRIELGQYFELDGAITLEADPTSVEIGKTFEILDTPGGLRPTLAIRGLELSPTLQLRSLWFDTGLALAAQAAIPPDRLEPNNDCAAAEILPSHDQALLGLSIDSSDDTDWFRWTATQRGIFAANLFFDHEQGDLDLWVYDASGDIPIWSATRTDHEHIAIPVVPGASYCLRIFGASHDIQPNYELVTHLSPETSRIYVAQGDHIAVLTSDLTPSSTLSHPRFAGSNLADVEIGHGGLVYVVGQPVDDDTPRLFELTPSGLLTREIPLPVESLDGPWPYPSGLEVLDDMSILLAQPNDGEIVQVSRFSPSQTLLTGEFGVSDVSVLSTGQLVTSPFQGTAPRRIHAAEVGTAWHVEPDLHRVELRTNDGTILRTLQAALTQSPLEAIDFPDGSLAVLSIDVNQQSHIEIYDRNLQRIAAHQLTLPSSGLAISSLDVDVPVRHPEPDEDGDGLWDIWETAGLDINQDGVVDLDLPAMGANPRRKDLFVEVDAMRDRAPLALSERIAQVEQAGLATGTVLDDVVAAFLAAPVLNPDGTPGVRLHLTLDELNLDRHAFTTRWAEFDELKNGLRADRRDGRFGTVNERNSPNWSAIRDARARVFRYAMFADQASEPGKSGIAELPGNDFVVTLGGWSTPGGTVNQQTGTFMHELGHSLGLHHGGHEPTNFKPNYLSVMNYHWQTPHAQHAGWTLDFSRHQAGPLDELRLVESAGIGLSTANGEVPVGPFPLEIAPLTGPIDWDRNGDLGIAIADINRGIADVNGDGLVNRLDDSPGEYLQGSNDWRRLRYRLDQLQNFREFADGDKDRPEDADSDPTDLYDESPPDFLDRTSAENNEPDDAYCLDPLRSLLGMTIDHPTDVDWFKWVASWDGWIAIGILSTSTAPTSLRLQALNGALVPLDEITTSTSEPYVELRIAIQSTQTYYLQIVSDDGQSEGNYHLYFEPGDFNHDTVVDGVDIALFCSNQGPTNEYDLDGDQAATESDRDLLILVILDTTYGDANLDRIFDSTDLVAIFQFGQYDDLFVGNSTWETGDWNCDGEFNSDDLILAFQFGRYQP